MTNVQTRRQKHFGLIKCHAPNQKNAIMNFKCNCILELDASQMTTDIVTSLKLQRNFRNVSNCWTISWRKHETAQKKSHSMLDRWKAIFYEWSTFNNVIKTANMFRCVVCFLSQDNSAIYMRFDRIANEFQQLNFWLIKEMCSFAIVKVNATVVFEWMLNRFFYSSFSPPLPLSLSFPPCFRNVSALFYNFWTESRLPLEF